MNNEELEDMRRVVKLALIRVGIRCDLGGYKYLCFAIEKAITEPESSKNLCKGIYAKIKEKYNLPKLSSVERAIRHAITVTADTKTFMELNRMFKSHLFAIDDKPTAGELIHLIAEWYLLGLYKENN